MRLSPARTTLASVVGLLGLASSSIAGPVDYGRDVLPILSAHCFACHGPDAAKRKADLRLDTREGAVAEHDGKTAVAPGKPTDSELIARITAEDDRDRMPPAKAGPRLTADQVRVLRDWIEQGAAYADHWAFVPPRRPPIPAVRNAAWPRTPIDHFVLGRLEEKGLKPAPPASREVLIRRATLDLLGLPPTPAEIDTFLKDNAPDAYEKLIDRLLSSPHYGERWGRHWLDVARYADSGGFETDIFYASAWRYRDYVIRSFNEDKPYDRFVTEQLAGDELYPDDLTARLATALYTIGPVLEEAKMVDGKLDDDWLTDAVDTTGSAFLGLTVGCGRCHDHKYDPFSQKDYYGLQAIFAGSDLFEFKPDGSVLKERVALQKREKEFEATLKQSARQRKPGDHDEYPELPLRGLSHRTDPLDVRLLNRGELNRPGEVVPPALPARLAAGAGLDSLPRQKWRSALANWLTSKENPLTARVIVNRVWQGHFGQGLVRTPNDFGVRGELPTHPELLDWLAVEFMEHGWSLKRLHRLVMLSSTYRMSAAADPDALKADPDNHLLTRFQPRRVEAEVVWDAMRAVAGTLNRKMYGLPVGPPLDGRELIGNYRKWHTSPPEEANRRAVYVVVRRSFRFPPLSALDPAENVSSCGQRTRTVVPNQALALLNGRSTRDQAAPFAGRLLRETDGTPEAVATRAWLYAYGRPIADDEKREVVAFLRTQTVAELCAALFNTSEFLYLP